MQLQSEQMCVINITWTKVDRLKDGHKSRSHKKTFERIMGSVSAVGTSVGGATLGAYVGIKGGMGIGLDLGQLVSMSTGSQDSEYLFQIKSMSGVIGGVVGGIGGGTGGATLGYAAGDVIHKAIRKVS